VYVDDVKCIRPTHQSPSIKVSTRLFEHTQSQDHAIKKVELAATLRGSRPGVQSASLYDNFDKPGNYVIMTSLTTS